MHANNILHRDLKPDNILLHAQDGKYIGLVGDLGLCAILDPRGRVCHQPATEYWRAPECEIVDNHGKVRGLVYNGLCAWDRFKLNVHCSPPLAENVSVHICN